MVGGFAAAYGEKEVVAAYDRMMINLPTSTGNEVVVKQAERHFQHGKLNAQGLHTHYNQDGCAATSPPLPRAHAVFMCWSLGRFPR